MEIQGNVQVSNSANVEKINALGKKFYCASQKLNYAYTNLHKADNLLTAVEEFLREGNIEDALYIIKRSSLIRGNNLLSEELKTL